MSSPIALTAVVFAALVTVSCQKKEAAAGGGEMPPPVTEFVNPVQKEIIAWEGYTGRLTAVDDVEVRARVGGLLEQVHFEDGERVKKGDLLFSIDARPFRAELAVAKADLAQAKSTRDLAKANVDRADQLVDRDAISKEEEESRTGDFQVAESRVQAAEARVQTAELNLSYTEVRAPIDGRVADNFVTEGNLISGGSEQSTLLTTIVSVDPIYCTIEIDESSALEYLRREDGGFGRVAEGNAMRVEMALSGEKDYSREGVVNFANNTFDTGTATLRLRAQFPNEDGFLKPGMFTNVRLPGKGKFLATLVPEKAIQTQQDFTSVLTLDDSDTVQSTKVTLGAPYGDGMRVVTSELPEGARILVSGMTAVKPGVVANPKLAEEDSPKVVEESASATEQAREENPEKS